MNMLTAEVFDKVLISVLEKPLFRTGPRVIGAVLRSRYGRGGSILFSLALVLDGCRRSCKRTYKFVVNRKNSISAQQVMRRMNYRAWAWSCYSAVNHMNRARGRAGGGGA